MGAERLAALLAADPRLEGVLARWNELPEHIRAAILALVQTGASS